jgi:hypothetical protein
MAWRLPVPTSLAGRTHRLISNGQLNYDRVRRPRDGQQTFMNGAFGM